MIILMMSLKQIRKVIILLILILLAGGGGYWLGRHQLEVSLKGYQPKITINREVPVTKQDVDFSLFWKTWDSLEASYLDKKSLDSSKMVYGAISGMVASLGDPYTVFLPPSEQKQSKEDLSGAFDGVGIQLGYKDSKLAVIAPLKGMPAEKVGVKAGDLILRIRDEKKQIDKEAVGVTLPEAVNLIRGEKGTSVFLTFGREGVTEPFEVELVRNTIVVKSVEIDFKEEVAHLRLLRFGERTYQEWGEAVLQIEERRAKGEVKGVILDLRNNPGGFLQGAIFFTSEFLADGVVVKQEKSQNGGIESFSVNRKGQLVNIPLVVLVNKGSASASEIVAGALQERNRAKIVGEQTFGKGTIQEAQELDGGAGLHVTIARWLLPSGKSIDKEGIKPDVEIKMDENDDTKDPQFEKAIELLVK